MHQDHPKLHGYLILWLILEMTNYLVLWGFSKAITTAPIHQLVRWNGTEGMGNTAHTSCKTSANCQPLNFWGLSLDIQTPAEKVFGPPKWTKIYPKYRTSGGMTGCLGYVHLVGNMISFLWHPKKCTTKELQNHQFSSQKKKISISFNTELPRSVA